jgi:hypothetical protein
MDGLTEGEFSGEVSLSADGSRVAIGAFGYDKHEDTMTNSGIARLFELN